MKNKANNTLDFVTLMIYVLLSTIFSVAVLVCAALIFHADISAWNPTMVAIMFFIMTGAFCGAFLLLR